MVNKSSRSESNMTLHTREVLRPTICNVSKGNLALMPVVLRKIMVRREILSRFEKRQFRCNNRIKSACRPNRDSKNRSRISKQYNFDVKETSRKTSESINSPSTQSSQGERFSNVLYT